MRNLPKSGLFGKIQKLAANLWSRNVKIQHGLLGEPGRNPDYLRNCTPKKLRNINPKQIGPLGDPPHISFWKSGFKKSKHHLFQMVPNLAFLGKKRRNYWPRARAERNPDTAKKLVKSGVDTVSVSSAYYWFLMRYPKENNLYGYPLKMY